MLPTPFALSLSKHVLSGCRRQAAEGGFPSLWASEERAGLRQAQPGRLWLGLLLIVLWIACAPAHAQTFPPLTGRVVDNANLLTPADEAALTGKLEALENASSRQLVVATIPDLQGYPIEDYGYRLLRTWGIGQKKANNGAILIVAPNEKRVRIEVGYGLEPIVTDAFSGQVIRQRMTPRFKAGDYAGGINGGVDALVAQLQAPPEDAERAIVAARQAEAQRQQRSATTGGGGGGGSILPLIFWGLVIFFVILPMLRGGRGGRRHRRRGGNFPVILWGPGLGGGGGGWGGAGGFGGGGGGFGGFSGGGGSGGGGGASGSW